MKHLPLALASLLIATSAAGQGPWPEPTGHLFLSPGGYTYRTTASTNAAGEATPYADEGRFLGQGITLYGEFGLMRRWTLHAKAGFISNRYGDEAGRGEANQGAGDVEVGVRRLLLAGATKLAVRAEGISAALYAPGARPSLGYGVSAAQVTVIVGGGARRLRTGWWSVEGGYRHYFGEVPDQLRAVGTLGVGLAKGIAALGQLEAVVSPAGAATGAANPLAPPGATTLKPTLGLVLPLGPGLRAHVGVFREVVSRNAGLGQGAVANLWLHLPNR